MLDAVLLYLDWFKKSRKQLFFTLSLFEYIFTAQNTHVEQLLLLISKARRYHLQSGSYKPLSAKPNNVVTMVTLLMF